MCGVMSTGWYVPDVSKDRSTSNFRVESSKKNGQATRRHAPEDLNLKCERFENHKYLSKSVCAAKKQIMKEGW